MIKQSLQRIAQFWLNRQHRYGTYVSADMALHSKRYLADWCKSVPGLELDAVDADTYHATITYSRKPIPKVVGHTFGLPMIGVASSWQIFDNLESDGYRCLVLVLDCPELSALNAEIVSCYGATSNFADYIPHVTVSYNYPHETVPHALPLFELEFDGIIIEPLDDV